MKTAHVLLRTASVLGSTSVLGLAVAASGPIPSAPKSALHLEVALDNIDGCTEHYTICLVSCDRQQAACRSRGNAAAYCDGNYRSCASACKRAWERCISRSAGDSDDASP